MKILKITLAVVTASAFYALSGVYAQEEAAVSMPEAPAHIHGDIVYGDANAPIEIIEFGSLTCPHCASFNAEMLPFLKEKYFASGKVKLVFKNYVRDRLDMAAAITARCTDDLDKAKWMLDAFFNRQEEWVQAHNPAVAISSIGFTAGIPTERLRKCQESRTIMQHMLDEMKAGHEKYEIQSIPTIIVNGTKVNYQNYQELKDKIDILAAGQ